MELESEGTGSSKSDHKIGKETVFFYLGAHLYLTWFNSLARTLENNVNTLLG